MDQFGLANYQGDYSDAQSLVLKTLTPGGGSYVNWDLGTQQNAELTLVASVTMNTPTGWKNGRMAMLEVIQGGAGSFTITWASAFVNMSGLTLQTTAGYSDILAFKCVLVSGVQKFQLVANKSSTRA